VNPPHKSNQLVVSFPLASQSYVEDGHIFARTPGPPFSQLFLFVSRAWDLTFPPYYYRFSPFQQPYLIFSDVFPILVRSGGSWTASPLSSLLWHLHLPSSFLTPPTGHGSPLTSKSMMTSLRCMISNALPRTFLARETGFFGPAYLPFSRPAEPGVERFGKSFPPFWLFSTKFWLLRVRVLPTGIGPSPRPPVFFSGGLRRKAALYYVRTGTFERCAHRTLTAEFSFLFGCLCASLLKRNAVPRPTLFFL